MRIPLAIVVVVVFCAMLLFDTAALVRLTVFCVTGGCGIDPIGLVLAVGVLVVVGTLWSRWRRTRARVSRKGGGRPGRKAARTGANVKRAKPRTAPPSARKARSERSKRPGQPPTRRA